MRRLISTLAIALVASLAPGCADTKALHNQIEVLRTSNERLQQQFDDYVKSDARSSASVELAIQDIAKAVEAINRYIQRMK